MWILKPGVGGVGGECVSVVWEFPVLSLEVGGFHIGVSSSGGNRWDHLALPLPCLMCAWMVQVWVVGSSA